MEREYKDGTANDAQFFTGLEVEKSAAHNMKTLFVVGIQDVDSIYSKIEYCNNFDIVHVYFGANQSFNPTSPEEWDKWDNMIVDVLKNDYWVTLDLDVSNLLGLHECRCVEYERFIPMLSVKMPYIKLCNYNTVIKIDDTGFRNTNPGVWCLDLHSMLDSKNITRWDEYTNDEKIS